jgi:YidC/Oxa1 family membrane protein insertase
MPQQVDSNAKPDPDDPAAQMQQSMKTMNIMMPLMSAFFCFSLPAGMGLYWIAGAVIRSIQQIVINKNIDKMDFDKIIDQNSEKSAKKLEKMKKQQERMNAYAQMNTKNIQTNNQPRKTMQNKANIGSSVSEKEKDEAMKNAQNSGSSTKTGSGSMFEKAGMVKKYNEKNK